MTQVVRRDAYALARLLQHPRQVGFLAPQPLIAGSPLVIHLGDRSREALAIVFFLDLAGEISRFEDAAFGQPLRDAFLDDLTGRTELVTDALGLAHQRLQHD